MHTNLIAHKSMICEICVWKKTKSFNVTTKKTYLGLWLERSKDGLKEKNMDGRSCKGHSQSHL
jgi:hypothetical protein